MGTRISRRNLLRAAAAAASAIPLKAVGNPAAGTFALDEEAASSASGNDRILDMHVHFDEKNPNFIRDLVTLAERMNLTACLLTPYPNRAEVADAAKKYPKHIVPFGFIELDAPNVLAQVKDFQALGYPAWRT